MSQRFRITTSTNAKVRQRKFSVLHVAVFQPDSSAKLALLISILENCIATFLFEAFVILQHISLGYFLFKIPLWAVY